MYRIEFYTDNNFENRFYFIDRSTLDPLSNILNLILLKTPSFDLITSDVSSQLPKKIILFLIHTYNTITGLTYFLAL